MGFQAGKFRGGTNIGKRGGKVSMQNADGNGDAECAKRNRKGRRDRNRERYILRHWSTAKAFEVNAGTL